MPVRNTKGGITQYALRNWGHIDKSRFMFDWVTLDKGLSFESELVRQGCRVHHLSCRQEDDEVQFRAEMEAILANGYDSVHLHTSYWRGFLAEELAITAGVPRIIVHAHSTGIDVVDEMERIRLLGTHNVWKSKFSVDLGTHFAACSAPASEFLFGPQIPKERIIILKNAIDTDRFRYCTKARKDKRVQMGLSDKLIILQPGRLEYQKNHSFTLSVFTEVLRSISDVVLLFAGDGKLREALEEESKALGMSDKVQFLGFREDISDLLMAADLLVMPSIFEGLTIAAIEAQSSGIYCLLSDQMAEETIITNNAVRLPLDVSIWSDAIIRLAQDGYDRYDRSADITAAGYSLKSQIKVLENIYDG